MYTPRELGLVDDGEEVAEVELGGAEQVQRVVERREVADVWVFVGPEGRPVHGEGA